MNNFGLSSIFPSMVLFLSRSLSRLALSLPLYTLLAASTTNMRRNSAGGARGCQSTDLCAFRQGKTGIVVCTRISCSPWCPFRPVFMLACYGRVVVVHGILGGDRIRERDALLLMIFGSDAGISGYFGKKGTVSRVRCAFLSSAKQCMYICRTGTNQKYHPRC